MVYGLLWLFSIYFLSTSVPTNNHFTPLVFSSSFNKSFQTRPFYSSLRNLWMKHPWAICPLSSSQSYSKKEQGSYSAWKRLGSWKAPWSTCLIRSWGISQEKGRKYWNVDKFKDVLERLSKSCLPTKWSWGVLISKYFNKLQRLKDGRQRN